MTEDATTDQLREALAVTALTGPFFDLRLVGPGRGWQQPADLDVAALTAGTARQLGTSELRVAASILHLGFAARLWSPVLGCVLLRGVVPDLSSLLVQASSPLRLGLGGRSGWRAESPNELRADVVGEQLDGFAARLPVPLADGLLRGNSASAMIGALGELVRAHPGLTNRATALARALLLSEDLGGTGVLDETGPRVSAFPAFRRSSCCLYYRVPGGGLCGDCCLDRVPTV